MSSPLVNLNFLIMSTISKELQKMIMILISEWLISCIISMLFMTLLVKKHLIVSLGVGISSIIKMFLWLTFMVALGIIFAETTSLTKNNSIVYGVNGKISIAPYIFFYYIFIWVSLGGFESHETLIQLIKGEIMTYDKNFVGQAIESISNRMVDKGFNALGYWLGYYDEYVLHYNPSGYYRGCGDLEIHCKYEVRNDNVYGGYETIYEKLGEFTILEKQWKLVKKHIIKNHYIVDGKKVCFDNPYPTQPTMFIDGSDVPVNGYYE